jgi:branched-chain amino acid transport system ATP-binding protein
MSSGAPSDVSGAGLGDDLPPGQALLVEDLRVAYGRTEVLHGVSISAAAGECVAVIGRNGAGKSSLLNAIAGVATMTGGSVRLDGHDITKLKPHQRVSRGLSLTMEQRRIFRLQSVTDNLEVAAVVAGARRPSLADEIDRVYTLFPVLKTKAKRPASTLSGGEQQMLAIAQSLMSRPSVLLLDEPSAGLAPKLVGEVFDTLALLRQEGLTIVVVEQVVSEALRLASRGYVLNLGEVVLEGLSADLAVDPEVARVYLGHAAASPPAVTATEDSTSSPAT